MNESPKPTHRLYHVRDYTTAHGEEKAKFTELGAAWKHKDGKGYMVKPAFPIVLVPDEKYLLREDTPKHETPNVAADSTPAPNTAVPTR